MFRDQERYGRDPSKVVRTGPATFYAPLKWKEPKRIFVNSLSDFFIEEADAFRQDAYEVIKATEQHIHQILSKRPEQIKDRLAVDWGDGWDNVHLGVSIENQDYWYRAEILADIPAKHRFLSLEPLIGPINVLAQKNGKRTIDAIEWVIIGGESGNETGKHRYRPCKIEWIEQIVSDLRTQAPHVKIFVKQLGTYQYHQLKLSDRHGADFDSWPSALNHLKIRELIDFKQ